MKKKKKICEHNAPKWHIPDFVNKTYTKKKNKMCSTSEQKNREKYIYKLRGYKNNRHRMYGYGYTLYIVYLVYCIIHTYNIDRV